MRQNGLILHLLRTAPPIPQPPLLQSLPEPPCGRRVGPARTTRTAWRRRAPSRVVSQNRHDKAGMSKNPQESRRAAGQAAPLAKRSKPRFRLCPAKYYANRPSGCRTLSRPLCAARITFQSSLYLSVFTFSRVEFWVEPRSLFLFLLTWLFAHRAKDAGAFNRRRRGSSDIRMPVLTGRHQRARLAQPYRGPRAGRSPVPGAPQLPRQAGYQPRVPAQV